ncbi:YslB family protein [Halalkalibacter krulwichiae]|uniref:DUF2507 domain-containing protein n=1 Tax=Halalkalibacter krulwichiae TaxID=199441 RepID=A0A1X9MG86_9BACI|nr:YslB family protein [Halalkalibacter krulwichiae]ARK31654.1 hypothetical protein BkAM31D_18395 [Halalkalibacter krulwichiae]
MDQLKENFGYELLRNDVLKDILGKEHDSILYWIGKSLARKYPINTIEELILFFDHANWGTLVREKEKKNIQIFQLTGPWMNKKDSRCYQLEAGFLAQQLESWHNCITGATYTFKKDTVTITVELDVKDSLK